MYLPRSATFRKLVKFFPLRDSPPSLDPSSQELHSGSRFRPLYFELKKQVQMEGPSHHHDHGRECPTDAGISGILRGEGLGLFFNTWIPGGRLAKCHGKHGSVAVNDVVGKQSWNVQARLLYCDVL